MKLEITFGWENGPYLDITLTVGTTQYVSKIFATRFDHRLEPELPAEQSYNFTDEPDLQGTSLDNLHWSDLGPSGIPQRRPDR